jgi:hypothetical protein
LSIISKAAATLFSVTLTESTRINESTWFITESTRTARA